MSKSSTPYVIAGASPDIITPPGGWTPADIGGIKLWLRSERNVTLNGGGKLTSIKNGVDLSHIFSIPSPLSVPLDYNLAKYPDGGSRPTINFRGGNNLLYDGSYVGDEEEGYIWVPSAGHELLFDYRNSLTLYIVFKPTITPDGNTRVLWSNVQMAADGHRGVYSSIVGGGYHRIYVNWPGRTSKSSDNNKWATDYWAIVGVIVTATLVDEYYQLSINYKSLPVFTTSIPQEAFSSYINSAAVFASDIPSEDGAWIGGSHTPSNYWTFYGELAELIISEGIISESDESLLQDYLKSGI